MKLSSQFCTRAQAMRLMELGIFNDTSEPGTFYSVLLTYGKYIEGILGEQEDAPYKEYKPVKHYSVAELGVMLPATLHRLPTGDIHYDISKTSQCWIGGVIKYREGSHIIDKWLYKKDDKEEAQVKADLLIYLLESKLITVDACNESLMKDHVPFSSAHTSTLPDNDEIKLD